MFPCIVFLNATQLAAVTNFTQILAITANAQLDPFIEAGSYSHKDAIFFQEVGNC